MSSSPAICPLCNQVSFAIAIPEVSTAINKRGQDPEHRAKISTAMKKLWQDPEYQAKMRAARARRYNKRTVNDG
ncbi:hypothetical protein ES705_20064 [subsurface metagenome]